MAMTKIMAIKYAIPRLLRKDKSLGFKRFQLSFSLLDHSLREMQLALP